MGGKFYLPCLAAVTTKRGPSITHFDFELLARQRIEATTLEELAAGTDATLDARFARRSAMLAHPVFNQHHTETEMLRYIRRLEANQSVALLMDRPPTCTAVTVKLFGQAFAASLASPIWSLWS